jgi:hypothetical protein
MHLPADPTGVGRLSVLVGSAIHALPFSRIWPGGHYRCSFTDAAPGPVNCMLMDILFPSNVFHSPSWMTNHSRPQLNPFTKTVASPDGDRDGIRGYHG